MLLVEPVRSLFAGDKRPSARRALFDRHDHRLDLIHVKHLGQRALHHRARERGRRVIPAQTFVVEDP